MKMLKSQWKEQAESDVSLRTMKMFFSTLLVGL